MQTKEISVEALSGGTSITITNAAATSTQSPVVALPTNHPVGVPVGVTFIPDNKCYGRKGANPVAANDGTDQQFLANTPYRVELMVGERMAFISTLGGTISWTPAS